MSNDKVLPPEWILPWINTLPEKTTIVEQVIEWLRSFAHTGQYNLTELEIVQVFTLCHCMVDTETGRIISVSTSTDGSPTLRTYTLLYSVLDDSIYCVGVIDTYSLLDAQEKKCYMSESHVTSLRAFLHRLNRQKTKVSHVKPKFFDHFQNVNLTFVSEFRYNDLVSAIIHCAMLGIPPDSIANLENLSSDKDVAIGAQYVLWVYTCFAASPFDHLIDQLVLFEKQRFLSFYSRLLDVPWLRFEFVRRYFGVDWNPVYTNFYQTIFTEQYNETFELYDSAAYAHAHCLPEIAYADFYFECEARYSPKTTPFHCEQHKNKCGTNLSIKRGYHLVPYGFLSSSALKLVEILVLRSCLDYRRIYSTHEAYKTWNENVSVGTFTALRDSEEPGERRMNRAMFNGFAHQWYNVLQSARKLPLIQFKYHESLMKTVYETWETVIFFRRNQRLDEQYDTRTSKPTRNYNFQRNTGPLPTTYQELVEYARNYWSPCMNNLVAKCTGSHLVFSERLAVVRFLLSPKCGFSQTEGMQIWELFWVDSDVYNKWDSDYKRIHSDLAKNPDPKLKDWPTCNAMEKLNVCPFVSHAHPKDIEDLGNMLDLRKATCLDHLKSDLRSRKLMLKFKDPSVYNPNSYPFLHNLTMPVKD